MKKNTKILLSISISIVIILSFYFFYVSHEENDYQFYYSVKIINTDITYNSTVIVPLPDFYQNEQYWTDILLTESIKNGVINITIVNTEYGKGLLINSSNNAMLNITLYKKVPTNSLTMMETLNNRTFVCNFYTYNYSTNLVSIDVDFENLKNINSTNKEGHYFSVHIYPAPIGWYEYPGIHHEYPDD